MPDAIPTFGVNSRWATPARSELMASRHCVTEGVRLAFGESVDAIKFSRPRSILGVSLTLAIGPGGEIFSFPVCISSKRN